MRVFPVPADASSATLNRGSTARRRAASSVVTDIILPAHRGIRAEAADAYLVRPRRKLSTLDPVHGREEPRARIPQNLRGVARLRPDDGHKRPLAGEGDIGRFVNRPRFPAALGEPL